MKLSSQVHLYDFTVKSSVEVAEGIWRMQIVSPELASTLKAGQFINIEVPHDRSQLLRVPLSFSAVDPADGLIELAVAVIGDGTRRLVAMREAETSTVVGPCGHGWDMPTDSQGSVLLVSGGIGVAPLVAAAAELAKRSMSITAIVGAQSASRLWGTDELAALGAHVLITTDDGSCGRHGFTTDAMKEMDLSTFSQVMTCGPAPMMAGVAQIARKAGIKAQASLERMMTCGFGACHSCNVAMADGGYKFCCSDGPVFDTREVAW